MSSDSFKFLEDNRFFRISLTGMKNVIDVLEERGFIDQMTHSELRQRVESPIKAYVGFDPTSDSLHLGNLVGIFH